MLETLTIKNFGIIEYVTLDLATGLNILTGETGAGKSILIDALRFSLGERFQNSYLRDQADQCLVTAVFRPKAGMAEGLALLQDFPSDDGTLILQRSVTADGKNRVRINGMNATVAQLKELGDRLIDFHGPHDHQLLLAENMHLGIMDALTDFGKSINPYRSCYEEYTAIQKQIRTLQELDHTRERDLDFLTHQLKELEQVPLEDSDMAQLESDQVKVNNAEKLFANVHQALECLANEEAGIEAALSRAYQPLENLSHIDAKTAPYLESLTMLQENVHDLVASLRDYAGSLQFDPGYAQEVNLKIDIYRDIIKKYGPTLDNARAFHAEAKHKHDLLSNFEHNTESLNKGLKEKEQALAALAAELTKQRKKTAAFLKKTIEKEGIHIGF